MLDTIKKTLLAGMGLSLMTADKAAALAGEIADAAELPREKAQELVDHAVARARKGREDLESVIRKLVAEALAKANLATRDELAALESRLARLEQASGGTRD
jgi:polyhydroxyalkanoate synthesis regulator phasin